MTARIVLLQPPGTCRDFTRSGSIYPPLGLLQLQATAPDLSVVVDADGLGWGHEETVERVAAERPAAVGLTVTSFTLDRVERMAREFSARGVPVLVGGPHASLAPEDTLSRCPNVRWLVRGEGEVVFPELAARLVSGRSPRGLAGVCGREGADVFIDHTILQVPDLAALAPPSYDGLPIEAYWCPDALNRPMVTMITSRGCPHRCAFCSSPALLGRKVRFRPIDQVLADLIELTERHGVREVSFVDDVFTIKRERLLALCDAIVSRGLRFTWFCNARADQVTEEVAAAMRAAGCHQVYLGFESGDQTILNGVSKGTTLERLEHGAELLRAHGIGRSVGFVIGLPGETDDTVAATIAMAKRVKPERVQFTRFTPLVGSPLASSPSSSVGFHGQGDDRVAQWIGTCYAAVAGEEWGHESW